MIRSMIRQFFISALPCILQATYFANPGEPALLTEGLIQSPPGWYCLRVGYMTDRLYQQNYKEEFPSPGEHPPSNYTQMNMDAATIALAIKNRFDITLLLGSAQIQLDQDLFTKRQFVWSLGGKYIIYKTGSLYVGLDMKYLESKQKPLYFLGDGYAYNIVSDFKLDYTEMQAALGAAYKTTRISPYIYLSYLYSKIEPSPYCIIVRIPTSNMTVDTSSHSIINQRRWGMALGGTVIGGKEGSLSVETRFFNQNAINVSGELRF